MPQSIFSGRPSHEGEGNSVSVLAGICASYASLPAETTNLNTNLKQIQNRDEARTNFFHWCGEARFTPLH